MSSSGSPPNYTEGVPIKISERYKPPPEIQLPTRLLQQLAKANAMTFDDDHVDYDFSLERKIISKSSEWISIRLRERQERQERIHQREVTRQRQIEAEHKLKLHQVSYPSADEISSCDEDDEVTAVASKSDETTKTSSSLSPKNFNTILLPTQATAGGVDIASNYKKSHRRYASNSSNKIDFSFFESDASPFDHLEMKSMNEMEMLAEVLGSSAIKGNQVTCEPEASSNLERDNSSESDNSSDQKSNNNVVVAVEQQVSQLSQQQQQFLPQMYVNNGGYYGGSNYYSNFATVNTATAHQPTNPMNYLQHSYISHPQNYAVNYQYNNGYSTNNNTIVAADTAGSGKLDECSQPQQRTRNIPSIIQELNDELNNSQRRRNLSQSSQRETVLQPEGELTLLLCLPRITCIETYVIQSMSPMSTR